MTVLVSCPLYKNIICFHIYRDLEGQKSNTGWIKLDIVLWNTKGRILVPNGLARQEYFSTQKKDLDFFFPNLSTDLC